MSAAAQQYGERKYRATRASAKAFSVLDAEDQIETELHPAELRLIDCDAGNCPFNCGRVGMPVSVRIEA